MSDSEKNRKLDASVVVVGAPWIESPYYEEAEHWTHLFWDGSRGFRRLFDKMDLTSVVELSCGHGRHSERVAEMTDQLTLMDIHEGNLEACRLRLKNYPLVRYIKGDGYSFQPLESNSTTSIYCYDSMVHFSPDIVESYIEDAARVLTAGGMALFHHSNYPAPLDQHYGLNPHARNHMTKALFADYAGRAELLVNESIVIPWGGTEGLDCLTLLQRPS